MKVQFKRNGYCEYDNNVMAYAKEIKIFDSLFRDLLLNFDMTKLYEETRFL